MYIEFQVHLEIARTNKLKRHVRYSVIAAGFVEII